MIAGHFCLGVILYYNILTYCVKFSEILKIIWNFSWDFTAMHSVLDIIIIIIQLW